MTGYERITRALRFEQVAPPPRMLHNFMVAAEYAGYTMKEYREDPRKIARCHIDFARRFDMDGILLDIDTCLEASALGIDVDYPVHEPARILHETPWTIEQALEAMDKTKLHTSWRIEVALEAMRLMRKEVGGDLFLRGNVDQGPFSLAMLAIGITEFMLSLYDDPENILLLIEKAYEVHLEFHALMMEAGADITSFGDSSCGPDLISREMYRTFALPFHKRLAEDLKRLGITTICHICGKLDLILEDLVSAGFPAIEMDYKTDMKRARQTCADKAVVFGPIDPSGVFYFGTEESIRRETQSIVRLFDNRGLVIGAGCALPAGVPPAHIEAFVDGLKQYR